MTLRFRYLHLLIALLPMAGFAQSHASDELVLVSEVRFTQHREGDDLLSAGLGLDGLRNPQPPGIAEAERPTPAELRRRAIWSNWRGIADLSPGGGFERYYGPLPTVPGREFQALARLPGASQPHRVLLQLPDGFDRSQRCVVVAPSSGSRGVYGAIALAAPWALARGCALVYTDKGTGTDWFDLASGEAAGLDGSLSADAPAFRVAAGDGRTLVAFRHAHSGDHPEADWGRHVRQAVRFALQVLNEQRAPDEPPYEPSTTRVIAVGVSNGAGAVLRAAEFDDDLIDGVVAVSPNVWSGQGGRQLFDYGTEAALLIPCAVADARFDGYEPARPGGAAPPSAMIRCANLHQAGLLEAADPTRQAAEAVERLLAAGWTLPALEAAAISTVFDLWRAVGAAYASAYARTGPDAMPCGYAYALLDAAGQPRAARREERALWWSDTAGVPPAAGVMLLDGMASGEDPALPGLSCLRELAAGESAAGPAAQIRQSMLRTQAALPRKGLPVLLMHGTHDGLVPEAFSSGPYAKWVQGQERSLSYWRLDHVQHFDAFLGLPPLAKRYLPLLPYAWRGMDALWAHLQGGLPLPLSLTTRSRPRALAGSDVEPLSIEHLDLPPLRP